MYLIFGDVLGGEGLPLSSDKLHCGVGLVESEDLCGFRTEQAQ